jgi:quercetin dioxygenase-like cupin family protein
MTTYNVLGTGIETLLAADDVELAWVSGPVGPGAPPHAHPWRETFGVMEGVLDVDIDGRSERIGAGEMTTIPGGSTHAFTFVDPGTRFLLVSHSKHSFEFFAEMSERVTLPPDMDLIRSITARHDIQLFV